jgi:hypothetical protein
MTEEQQEVVFFNRMTHHWVGLIREFAEHLDNIDSDMTAAEALGFFADSLDPAGSSALN